MARHDGDAAADRLAIALDVAMNRTTRIVLISKPAGAIGPAGE